MIRTRYWKNRGTALRIQRGVFMTRFMDWIPSKDLKGNLVRGLTAGIAGKRSRTG